MTTRDQRRAQVLARLVGGELSMHEAAVLLGLSERQVWRLRARFLADGPAALVHGNRGRASPRRSRRRSAARVVELAADDLRRAPTTRIWPSCSPSARASPWAG